MSATSRRSQPRAASAARLEPESEPAPARSRLGAMLGVGALVLLGGVASLRWQLDVNNWKVMTDELLYSRLGMSVADTLSPVPRIHGEYYGSLNMLYPILIAPAYMLGSAAAAFNAIHVLNGFIFASAAIPAYLLAREVVDRRWVCLLVAALAIAVPWAAMSLMILTETAAYPAFLWGVLGIQRTLVAPSLRHDALALAGVGLAFMGRTQFAVLAPLLPVAVLLHEFLFALATHRGRRVSSAFTALVSAAREHALLTAVTLLGVLFAAVVLATGSVSSVLGNYSVTAEGELLPPGWVRAAGTYLAFVAVGIGVVPLVAAVGWSAAMLARPEGKRQHAFATLTGLVVAVLTIEVTSVGLRFSSGIQDRYLFYIVPLLLVATAACLAGRSRPWPWLLAAGPPVALLLSLGDYLPSGGPFFGSPASAFHKVLDGQARRLGGWLGAGDFAAREVVVAASLLAAVGLGVALWRQVRSGPLTAVVLLALLAFGIAQTQYVMDRMLFGNSPRVSRDGGAAADRAWIDRAVRPGDRVALVPGSINTVGDAVGVQSVWWSTEMFNERATDSLVYGGSSTFTPFPEHRLRVDEATGRLDLPTGTDALVLSNTDVRFAAHARWTLGSPDGHLELARLSTRPAARWVTRGILADGWTVERRARLRVYPSGRRQPRRLLIDVGSTPDVERSRRIEARAAGRRATVTLRPGGTGRLVLDVCLPAGRPLDVGILTSGRTRLPDGRMVGLRVTDIRERPSGRAACGPSA